MKGKRVIIGLLIGATSAVAGEIAASSDPALEVLKQVVGLHEVTVPPGDAVGRVLVLSAGDQAMNGLRAILVVPEVGEGGGTRVWDLGLDVAAVSSVMRVGDAVEVRGGEDTMGADGEIVYGAAVYRVRFGSGGTVRVDREVKAARAAAGRDPKDWRTIAHPGDQVAVENIEAQISAMVQGMKIGDGDRKAHGELKALLGAESMPVTAGALVGEWRVRSFQGGPLGVFAYPFFKAVIKPGKEGGFTFAKTTGSQRRSGELFPEGSDKLVFLGAATVNDAPARKYSGFLDEIDGEDAEGDSVGVLLLKGKNRAALLMDASENGFEVYELVR